MLSCPRCQHLNPPDEQTCELCGAELKPAGGAQAVALEAGPLSHSGAGPAVAAERKVVPPPPPQNDEGGGLTAALLDALEQEKEEGRARGEGPRARQYLLKPLPVPDDIPAPSLGAAASVPLAGRFKQATRSNPGVPQPPPSLSPASAAGAVAVSPVATPAMPAPLSSPSIPAPMALDERRGADVTCPYCHTANPPGNRFCGGCGARLPLEAEAAPARGTARTEAPAVMRRATIRVTLVCINEDGSDGARIPLAQPENVLGRGSDARFANDSFLSPRHAKLVVDGDHLYVEDLNSLNGTFVRIRDTVKLEPSDCFLMGRQVLRLELFNHQINPKARSSDGTRYMGSPIPTGRYKLLQVGIGGVIQNVYCVPGTGAVLGRERGDITFPGDKFMSAKHAELTAGDDGEVYLSDANSSNGTWIRISKRHRLTDQDFIFLGQQLFRVAVEPT